MSNGLCEHAVHAEYQRTRVSDESSYPDRWLEMRREVIGYITHTYSKRHRTNQPPTQQQVHQLGIDPRIERTFSALADEWQRDTAHLSSIPTIVMHPAHQQIIGMGPGVLPLILRHMRDRPGYWFWALETIARETPITAAMAGDIRQMKQAWLNWGTERGLI